MEIPLLWSPGPRLLLINSVMALMVILPILVKSDVSSMRQEVTIELIYKMKFKIMELGHQILMLIWLKVLIINLFWILQENINLLSSDILKTMRITCLNHVQAILAHA